MTTTRSTCIKGIAKSRRGSPAIGLQTLIDRAVGKKRPGIVKESEVSDEEALEAAELLSKKRSPFRYLDAGAVSGALSPAIQAAGRGTQALVDAKKGRWGAARRALTDTSKGELAKNVLQGTLFGSGIAAAREGVQLSRAKNTYENFLKQHGTKTSGAARIASRLRAQGFMADRLRPIEREALGYVDEATLGLARRREKKDGKAKTAVAASGPSIPNPPKPKSSLSDKAADSAAKAGRFKGVATQNSLKPPGPAVSKQAINPRRNITQAINAFRS